MLPEGGYFALIFATLSAGILVMLSLWGTWRRQPHYLDVVPFLTLLQGVAILLAFLSLVYAFVVNDFSLRYVAAHSNNQLPVFFKVAATWGGHEGSMLFWLTVLAVWSGVFCLFSRGTDRLFRYRTLTILSVIVLGFLVFILMFSDPFERHFPPPPQGRDLNPMLQDIGLIFHPPLLYLGYVGFALSFAMVMAGLWAGRLTEQMIAWIRPWTMLSWGFLTAGIMLGAWWAYYELGWGGWWFWDPVENASLMPWLLGTALVHSLIISQARGIFSHWTVLLAIFAFAFSLLGTFIVRSGVLTSVHAFAVDADRGVAILLLFFLLSFFALSLFALRAKLDQPIVSFQLLSKESAFLLLNGLFAIATCTVLLGTFYPMVFAAMNWGSLSVGAPYFNTLFLPLVLVAMLAIAVAPRLRWQHFPLREVGFSLRWLPIAILIACYMVWNVLQRSPSHTWQGIPLLLLSLAMWVILTHLPVSQKNWRIRPLAMRLAHMGFAVCVIGAMMNSYYGDELGVRLKPQTSAQLANLQFHYVRYQDGMGANYTAEQAVFQISENGKPLATIVPERRYYDVRSMTMSEVGLYHIGLLDDVYIVMGDRLGQGEYAFRLHYKPYVRALWLGAAMMVIAAVLALLGHLFRRRTS